MKPTPQPFYIPLNRRRFMRAIYLASAGFTLKGFLAEALAVTPTVTQGPYYPLADDIPLDDDNDLVQLNNNLTIASGPVTYVTGTVYDANSRPVKNALVELWHADYATGNYIYNAGVGRNPAADPNFAGFGQFLTGSSGRFKFRTVKAGLYNGRTRHYHWAVTLPGMTARSATQTGWNETAVTATGAVWPIQNASDMVFAGVTDPVQRTGMLLNFTAVPGTTTGEVQTTWDYYSASTPVEPSYPAPGGFNYRGVRVAGPSGGSPRFKITFPAYAGYQYEVYADPTLSDIGWKALPFSLTQIGAMDRNRHVATAAGALDIYVDAQAVKGAYKVSFRPPGSNFGTP